LGRLLTVLGLAVGVGGIAAVLTVVGLTWADTDTRAGAGGRYTVNGALRLPVDWRGWRHIGTQITPRALNDAAMPVPGFHAVYMDRESWRYWQATGRFRDGTMIVREIVGVSARVSVGRKGYYMGRSEALHVKVKDRKRFPNRPGNWGYFSFGRNGRPFAATAKVLPAKFCNGCHAKNGHHDLVFTKFYPGLRRAKEQVRAGR
jgi:hypothetical protein